MSSTPARYTSFAFSCFLLPYFRREMVIDLDVIRLINHYSIVRQVTSETKVFDIVFIEFSLIGARPHIAIASEVGSIPPIGIRYLIYLSGDSTIGSISQNISEKDLVSFLLNRYTLVFDIGQIRVCAVISGISYYQTANK